MEQEPLIRFSEILKDELASRGRGIQKKIAMTLNISESTVTQYAKGTQYPKLSTLVQLAKFLNRSLDYLVLGKPLESAAGMADQPLLKHLESAFARSHARAEDAQWLASRIADALSRNIKDVARQEVERLQVAHASILTDDEVMALEECSDHSYILTTNLYDDLENPTQEIPGRFFATVASNVQKKRKYRYFFPAVHPLTSESLTDTFGVFRKLLNKHCGESLVHECVSHVATESPLFNGCVIYELDVEELMTRSPLLHARVQPFIFDRFVGYSTAPSEAVEANCLMDDDHLTRVRNGFDRLSAVRRIPKKRKGAAETRPEARATPTTET